MALCLGICFWFGAEFVGTSLEVFAAWAIGVDFSEVWQTIIVAVVILLLCGRGLSSVNPKYIGRIACVIAMPSIAGGLLGMYLSQVWPMHVGMLVSCVVHARYMGILQRPTSTPDTDREKESA